MKDIRISWQTVEDLKKLIQKEDTKNLSLTELVNHIENKTKTRKEEEKLQDESIKEKYKDSYYIGLDNDSKLFGKHLVVYHFLEIAYINYSTDNTKLYNINFEVINIGEKLLTHFNNNKSFSLKELNSLTEITKNEFVDYLYQYNKLKEDIINIINKPNLKEIEEY